MRTYADAYRRHAGANSGIAHGCDQRLSHDMEGTSQRQDPSPVPCPVHCVQHAQLRPTLTRPYPVRFLVYWLLMHTAFLAYSLLVASLMQKAATSARVICVAKTVLVSSTAILPVAGAYRRRLGRTIV